jgi:hypothetical protein
VVLERSDMYFAYRPRIDVAAARRLADVQRLYMLLSPHGGKGSHRLIAIGGKRLRESRWSRSTRW